MMAVGNVVRVRLLDCVGACASASADVDGDVLPADVLARCISFLDPPDVGHAMLACTAWNDVIRARDRRRYDDPRAAVADADFDDVCSLASA